MTKLNEKKIKWTIREMEKRNSVSGIAKIQKVSRWWVNELHRRYKETGEIPVLGMPGRPVSPPSEDVVDTVLRYHEKHGMGACGTEMALGRDGVRVPHNRIHAILKSRGRPKKRGADRPAEFEWWSLVVVLLIMQYLGLGYRLTAAHISARPELMKMLELDKPPSKSAIHRAQQALSQGWLEELNRRVLFQLKKGVARRSST